MEELKILIEMVADLPQMAIWVLLLFFVYKTIVIGSIFGIVRLFINRLHSVLVAKAEAPKEVLIDGLVIGGAKEELVAQISRLKGLHSYVRGSDVDRLRKAIDLMKENNKPTP